jgi:uncharacterized protein
MADPKSTSSSGPSVPWWRFPIVWMVIGGPAIVVVAGIATAVIAIKGADEVLPHQAEVKFSDRPAVQGRNHSATSGQTN